MSYQVLRQLAGGGFSEIFEVEDAASALPERLILKRLTAEMSARPDVQAAFSEEAKILRELKHPNVVTFRRCYFDEKRRICLLMEKVAGEPLDVWARRHASQPELVLDLFTGVLAAVDYLHHRPSPFLHLDLKPDNLLVTSGANGPEPMLIDFGIARRSGGRGLKAYTPPYGAPEQEAGGKLDCATDVYALGQILKELLAIVEGGLTEPARAAVGAVVEKATRPSRRERYLDAGEMRIEFRRACRAKSSAPAFSGSAFRLPRLPRWALLGAGAGFCLLLIAVAVLTREETEPPASGPSMVESVQITPEGRFDELQYKFEEALIQGHSDAESYYQQALELSDSLPEGSDAWRQAKGGLDMMSIHLSQAQAGGTESEEVRAILRQKHLTYQKP
jgi:eukaryotic-like serine/threonine-protein kinase